MREFISLKHYVYEYIAEKINKGLLAADDKINEVKISEELNVSRTPIREALMQLASDGYLENTPRKGFKVKRIDITKAMELYDIIGILEARAAASSMEYLTEEDIKKLESFLYEMEKMILKGLHEDYYDLQIKFHDVYIQKCKNKELVDLLKKLKMYFMRKNYSVTESDDIKSILLQTNNEHKEILELIKNKDSIRLQAYLTNIHWAPEKAKFDSW